MAMGQQKDRQGDLMVSWSEMPRSPGHVFYDRLQLVLALERGFDGVRSRGGMPALLLGDGLGRCGATRAVVCTWGLLRGPRRNLSVAGVALIGFGCRSGVPAVGDAGTSAGPFAARPARAATMQVHRRATLDSRAADRRGGLVQGRVFAVDASTMVAEVAAALRNIDAEGPSGRGLPGDAGALGPGERYRDTHG